MQVEFTFHSQNGFTFPVHYNHIIQGFLYNSIDSDTAHFLHDTGYVVENRSFKLFAFSRLLGKYTLDKENKTISFAESVKLWVASPVEKFCYGLCNHFLSDVNLRLGDTQIEEVGMKMEPVIVKKDSALIQTQSPITVYSTMLRPDGRKYTCYFQPGEADFDTLITSNLQKKYTALFNRPAPEKPVTVQALGHPHLNIVDYKGTVIKGYSGRFRLDGPAELLHLALHAGLGSKNSQGFGYIELLRRRQQDGISTSNTPDW